MQELNKKHFKELLLHLEENILMKVVMILMVIGEPMMIEGPLEKEGIKVGVEGHWIEGIIMIEVTLEQEDSLMEVEDPLMEMEDPLMEEDPLIMEDPWKWMTSKIPRRMRTTRPTRTPWTSETCYSATAPGNFGHNSSRKHLWYSRPIYVTIG